MVSSVLLPLFLLLLLLLSAVLPTLATDPPSTDPHFLNFITEYNVDHPKMPYSVTGEHSVEATVKKMGRFGGSEMEMQLVNNMAKQWGGVEGMLSVHDEEQQKYITEVGVKIGSRLDKVAKEQGEEGWEVGVKVFLVTSQLAVMKQRTGGPHRMGGSGKSRGKGKRKLKKNEWYKDRDKEL